MTRSFTFLLVLVPFLGACATAKPLSVGAQLDAALMAHKDQEPLAKQPDAKPHSVTVYLEDLLEPVSLESDEVSVSDEGIQEPLREVDPDEDITPCFVEEGEPTPECDDYAEYGADYL